MSFNKTGFDIFNCGDVYNETTPHVRRPLLKDMRTLSEWHKRSSVTGQNHTALTTWSWEENSRDIPANYHRLLVISEYISQSQHTCKHGLTILIIIMAKKL